MTREKDDLMDPEPLLLSGAHRSLMAAARRRAGRRSPHRAAVRFRGRTVGLTAAATVLAGGTALAATAPWTPTVGDDDRGHPTTVNAAAPSDQLAALSALRRPQSDADKTPGVTKLLTMLSPDIEGLRTSSVRALKVRADGTTVMFTAERVDESGPGSPAREKRDVVCMLYGTNVAIVNGVSTKGPLAAGQRCGTTGDLRGGRIFLGTQWGGRLELNGLVPDGVAKVALTLRTGQKVEAAVESNTFHIDTPAPDGSYEDTPIQWLDAHGEAVPNG